MSFPRSSLLQRLILSAIPLLFVTISCSKSEPSADVEARLRAIGDSLKESNIPAARRIVAEGMRTAEDSDDYFQYLMEDAVLDYYSSRPDSLRRKAMIVMKYLEGKSPSQARSALRMKAMGAFGALYTQYSHLPDSSEYFQAKAVEAARELDSKDDIIRTLGNLADTYKNNGKLDLSADTYGEAISLADSIHSSPYTLVQLYAGIASVYTALHDFENSDIWWRHTGELYDVMLPYERFNYLNNRGNDLFLKGDYNGSLKVFRRLEAMLDSIPDTEWEQHFCSTNLADVYLMLGDADQAAARLPENMKFFSEVQPNPLFTDHMQVQRMRLAYLRGENAEVERLLHEAPIHKALRPELLLLRLRFENEYYSSTHQWEKAYRALEALKSEEDSMINERVHLKTEAMRMGYERDAKVTELSTQVARNQSHMRMLLTAVVSAVIMIVLLVLLVLQRRRMGTLKETAMLANIMALRSRLSRSRNTPHFIYNLLNQMMARREAGKPDNLDSVVKLLRIQQSVADEIACRLSLELEFVNAYTTLRSEGMNRPVEYSENIEEGINPAETVVPATVIQILVENAFKHGFPTLPPEESALLVITVARTADGGIRITVANNAGSGVSPVSDSTRQGMRIIDSTIRILNEKARRKITFKVARWTYNPQSEGFIAEIAIPEDFPFPEECTYLAGDR